MRHGGNGREPDRRGPLRATAASGAHTSRIGFSWLLAAGVLLLTVVLLGTGSVAWAELRPRIPAALDPARYDFVLDVPQARDPARVQFGVRPRRDVPPAVLRIPRLQIEAAVHHGTGPDVLFRGAGLLAGSALPDGAGPVALALHGDRQFRRLSELEPGDIVAVDTSDRTRHYRVTQLAMHSGTDASLFSSGSGAALTLVASYPSAAAYGATPRYIVQAELVERRAMAPSAAP